MAYKGRFKPKNPEKYVGDYTNIIYRSLLERSYMVKLDENPKVLQWKSEEVIIPYISPLDNERHRYFPDFWIKYIDEEGITKTALIEIKPKSQTKEPKPQSKKTQKYIREVTTWLINNAKWNAAINWCKLNNSEFHILTEEDIRPYKGNKYRNAKSTNSASKTRTRRSKTPTR